MKSGSLCLDYSIKLPEKGIVEFVSYPNTGLTAILTELCNVNVNAGKNVLYFCSDVRKDILDNRVLIYGNEILEAAVDMAIAASQEMDTNIIVFDNLTKFVSLKEIEVINTEGIEHLDNSIRANIWFESLRILRKKCIDNEILLVIGNNRRTRILNKLTKGYESNIPRPSAQNLDIFSTMTIQLEVYDRQENEKGEIILVSFWTGKKKKEDETLFIPIKYGKLSHLEEKLNILEHMGIATLNGNIVNIDGKDYSYPKEFKELVGIDYSLDFLEQFNI